MTVPVQVGYNQYLANGANSVFPYTFKILQLSDIKVYIDDVLQVGNYNVSGIGNNEGGNVTFTLGNPANGSNVEISRTLPIEQQLDLGEYTRFPAESVERQLDRMAMIDEQLYRDLQYAIDDIGASTGLVGQAAAAALDSIAADVSVVDSTATSALGSIAADVSAVDSSRIAAQAAMNSDVNAVDTSAATALTNIAIDVSAVDSSAASALVSIAADVSVVDSNKAAAQLAISADVGSVQSAADVAIAVEIPAQINRIGLQYPPINYIAGLTLDDYTKLYRYDGDTYLWGGMLGTVTTGAFDETGWVPKEGDAQLREDTEKGTSIIRDVKHVSSISALRLLEGRYDGQIVVLNSFFASDNITPDFCKWDSSSTEADNGVTVFAVTGVATGRWIRLVRGFITPEMAGAPIDSSSDCTPAFDAIRALGYRPYLTSGITYNVTYTAAVDLLDVCGLGAVTNGFVTIYADEIEGSSTEQEEQQSTPVGPTVRRQRTTHADLELFVDASVITSGNGSQVSPFKTINEALSLVPREIYHKVRIYLADGVYSGAGNYFSLYNYFVTPWSGAGLQIIGHIPENPLYADTNLDAVVIGNASGAADTDNFVIGGVIGDTDDTKIAGVTFDGRVQIYGCNFAFDRTKHKKGKNGELVGGHAGRIKFTSSVFSDAATFFSATDLAHFFVNNCTLGAIAPSSSVAQVRNGSFLMFENSVSLATSAVIVREGNSIVMIDGSMVSTGSSGATKGTQEFALVGPNGNPLLHANSVGSLYSGGVYVFGRPAAPTLPAADSGTFFIANDGSVFIKVKFGGVEKQVKIWDFTTNTVQ